MSGQEFTQTFKVEATVSGLTPLTCFQMEGTGVYIVKNIAYYATVNFASGAYVVQFKSSLTAGAGSGLIPIYTVSTDVPVENEVINIEDEFILTQNCIGISGNLIGAGDLYFTITYIYIPYASTWVNGFLSSPLLVSPSTNESFSGPESGNAYIIKSIIAANFTGLDGEISLSYNNGTMTALLATQSTVDAGETFVYSLPLYLQPGTSVSINNVGSAQFDVLISYTQDPGTT